MSFQAGQSGNPGGRATEKLVKDAMRLAAKEKTPEGVHKLRAICAKVVDKAVEGDIQAASVVFDRLDGKPVQQQILSGDEVAPLMHKVVWDHVKSTDSTPKDTD